jgi:hypothetical protein
MRKDVGTQIVQQAAGQFGETPIVQQSVALLRSNSSHFEAVP